MNVIKLPMQLAIVMFLDIANKQKSVFLSSLRTEFGVTTIIFPAKGDVVSLVASFSFSETC